MQAIQFIKDHGVDRARDVVKGAPKGAQYYRDMDSICHPNEVLYYAWFGCALLVIDEHEGWVKSIYHNGAEYIEDQLADLKELKRLVESVDLVESWGGIEAVKRYDLEPCKNKPESAGYRLIQAIADYETIYLGEEQ
ncbi:hypothetical protein [Acinetobacter sp. 'aerobic (ED)']|uniref:hypothetical protein n=1 Tax=Acinetobacter sp. 'aerobic (ED)' TaxID=174230 RepID=UPI001D0E55BC|nr:hypothetical protein [Acinetobacter sp. 'aerobic (ED)']